jgi:SAM-dependent methyltransferase
MNLLKRLVFQLWYYRNPPWDTHISPPELHEFIESHPPGRALDLGCGTGTNAILLAQCGWQVTGIDFAWKAISTAKRTAHQAHLVVDFRVGDVSRLTGIRVPFDLILDIGCYHSLDRTQRMAYCANLDRYLAAGGSWLLYGFLQSPTFPTGLSEGDFHTFEGVMQLLSRQDSRDDNRAAVWLHYTRHN